jgi:transposase
MASIIKVKEVSEMSAKKQYDVAFKKKIAQVYLDGQRTAPSLAEELGLYVNTIYKWAEQYKEEAGHWG